MVTGVVLIAIAQPVMAPDTPTAPASPDPVFAEALRTARIERLVKARLRDPDSARFQHLPGGCGLVNSRNGFGGMSGNQPFVVTAGKAVLREDHPKDFAAIWRANCVP